MIGVCRGTSEQKEPFDALIRMNGWNNYDHIFINQDEPNDEVISDINYFSLLYWMCIMIRVVGR